VSSSFYSSSSASAATKIATEVRSSLIDVARVQDGLQKSLKKAKGTIEYVENKLLEVRPFFH
jgi:hypothetical protein